MKMTIVLLPFLLSLAACQSSTSKPAGAPAQQTTGKFTYAPEVGSTFRHTMSRFQEVAIVGAPLRTNEEWEAVWDITVEQETNLYLYRAKLSSLKISANGAPILKGPEIAGYGAFLELLSDSQGKVVDVRRTSTITAALMEVLPGPSREAVAQAFSPDMLRAFFLERANERTQDLIGNPTPVGSTWGGRSGANQDGPATKSVTVEAEVPCDAQTCLRVSRSLTVDQEAIWQTARARVEAHVKERGGDPTQVQLKAADIKVEDEFIVNPNTMQLFGATFDNQATLSVTTPDGDLTVAFTTRRGSTYEY